MKEALVVRLLMSVLWILGRLVDKDGNGIPDFLEGDAGKAGGEK